MKKRLILHTGMPKTGTSSLQSFLASNIELLEEFNIHYPRDGSIPAAQMKQVTSGNGQQLAKYLIPDGENLPLIDREFFKKEFFKTLRDCPRDILLSSEFLFYPQVGHLKQFKQDIEEYGYQLQIIFYVRDIADSLYSLFSQEIKRANLFDNNFLNYIKKVRPFLKDRCNKFINIFGEEAITIRAFSKKHFHQNNLLADFLLTLGLSSEDIQKFDLNGYHINRALSRSELNYLARLNQYLPPGEHSTYISDVLMQNKPVLSKEESLIYISRDEYNLIREKFGEELEFANNLLEKSGQSIALKSDKTSIQDIADDNSMNKNNIEPYSEMIITQLSEDIQVLKNSLHLLIEQSKK